MLHKRHMVDQRLNELEQKKLVDAVENKKVLEAKQKYRQDVMVNMQHNEADRKNQILQKRNEQDFKVQMTMESKLRNQLISKEQNNLKREDRQKTVERIMRQNEYHKMQIKARIRKDDQKT